MTPSALAELAEATVELAELADREAWRFIRWTPPQDAFHRLRARRKLFRAGNQAIGKTWAGLKEVIWRCEGRHPHYHTRPPPIEAWVVCTSWSQSVAIMKKFHALCPEDQIDHKASSNFSVRSGYGKDNPAVVFHNGSIVRFRTTNQGPTALQGSTVHVVHIDEPTDLEIYRELDRRLTRTGGPILITATPINRDCAWLRDLVEDGVIEEVHARLTVENATPMGSSRPLTTDEGVPMDAAWIAEQWRVTPSVYAPVVLDGEWEMRPEGVFFDVFDADRHVNGAMRLDPDRAPVWWCLGIDYAAAPREYGQTAILAQVQQLPDDKGRIREAILVQDEVVMAGVASNAQFAARVLEMLSRHNIQWRDLKHVYGDNPVASRWVKKSNFETMRALSRELGISQTALRPRILSAKEGRLSSGMVDAGCRYIYENLAEGRCLFHPRAALTIDAFGTWDYGREHPAKDRIDAVRYLLKPFIFPRGRGHRAVVRFG